MLFRRFITLQYSKLAMLNYRFNFNKIRTKQKLVVARTRHSKYLNYSYSVPKDRRWNRKAIVEILKIITHEELGSEPRNAFMTRHETLLFSFHFFCYWVLFFDLTVTDES